MDQLFEKITQNTLWAAITASVGTAIIVTFFPWMIKKCYKFIKNILIKTNKNKKFQQDYINWIINTNKYISMLPSTIAAVKSETLHQIELDQIYIALSMSQGDAVGKEIALEDALSDNKIIILGDPGAGKTTLMQYLTLHFASRFIKENKNKYINMSTPKFDKMLPILIKLSRFHDIINWPKNKTLLNAIKEEIKSNIGKIIPYNFFEKKIDKGNCIFLFDAFDELASPKARQLLAQKVEYFIATCKESNKFIVTSRPHGYSGQLARAGFSNPYIVLPLKKMDIEKFVHKWYENISHIQSIGKPEDEQDFNRFQNEKKAQDLTNTIFGNEGIRELAINPMMLSLISLVHYVKVKLPEERHLLYRECIEILIEQWDSVKGLEVGILKQLNLNEKKSILQKIAHYMHEHKLRSISKPELLKNIVEPSVIEICGEKISVNHMENLLNAIEERTGLLIEKGFNEKGDPEISFSHLTFQEYLTSLEITGIFGIEDKIFDQILRRVDSDADWWMEVGLLTIAQFKNRLKFQAKLAETI